MVFSNNLLMGAAGQASGYAIDQSIRFNDDDSARLVRDGFGQSPTSSTVCTISVWVKRGNNFGSNSTIIYGGDPNGSTAEALRFGTGNQLQFSQASSDYDLKTSQIFVDPAAWYHIVAVLNTGAAESSRAALYVNGSQVTDFATENYPSSSYSTNFTANSSSVEHVIGANSDSGPASQFFDGYIADFNFIDGQALTPASFGETDSATGQWVPKKYTGGYGSNGFRLQGSDSADLGEDTSGNGNDFTSSGLAAADQMSDSPTNNFWTLNPLDSGATISDGNLKNGGGSSTNTHAPALPLTGKWYWEIVCTDINTGTTGAHFFGICDASVYESQSFSDHAAISAGQERGGQLKKNNSNTSTGTAVNDGNTVGLAFDADNLTLALYVDGSQSGSTITSLTAGTYKPWIQDGAAVTNMTVNFGQSDFDQTVPTGYSSLCTNNLPDPTIADPSAYFQPTTYTGDGSSSNEVNQAGNSNFEPSMVWIKSRSAATDHVIQDQVRGNFVLYPNQTSAQGATGGGWVSSFDSDGFTVNVNGPVNDSGKTFVGWQWKAAGSGSSNSDGSITSTVSASATSGFSIIKWTGTAANGTIGHGLGVQPSLYILKNTATTNSWIIGSTLYAATAYLSFNTDALATGDAAVFNSTHPTSSVINLGSNVGTNGSSGSNNMICYAFADVEGFSKIGTYEGNGSSTDGPFIYTGFKPRWIMIKRYDATESWPILDTARASGNFGSATGTGGNSPTAGNDLNAVLVASTGAAEEDNPTGSRRASYLSNGFKVKTTNTAMNASGGDYIYLAFAESPFKTATAR